MPIQIGAIAGIAFAIAIAMLVGLFHTWGRHKFTMPCFIISLTT